jgi:hypothetical protein
MQKFWDNYYKPANTLSNPSINTSANTLFPTSSNPLNQYLEWKTQLVKMVPTRDKYTRFCKLNIPPTPGLLYQWWLEPQQQREFLNLSKMALDILLIPAMSADPERLFSLAGLTITDHRNRLGIDVIKAIECLKS